RSAQGSILRRRGGRRRRRPTDAHDRVERLAQRLDLVGAERLRSSRGPPARRLPRPVRARLPGRPSRRRRGRAATVRRDQQRAGAKDLRVPGHGALGLPGDGARAAVRTVMDTESALLSALHASPGDDVSWLALADWLEEQGEAPRAELLRLTTMLRRA